MIESLKSVFKDIGNEISSSNKDIVPNFAKELESSIKSFAEADKPILVENSDVKGCPLEGNGGTWDGERGNSNWHPDRKHIPENPKTNPDKLSWGEILDKYGIDSIPFKDGEVDFSEVSKGTVKIDDFSERRYGKGGNFDQATERLAEQKGCTKEEVKKWMEENRYTWHEGRDCSTMSKVPTEVHGNVRHSGGISVIKAKEI